MTQLKKLGAIGGVVGLVLCWPLAVGQIGERVIEDGIEEANNETLKAEIVEYDRGYLSSVAKTRYSVRDEVFKAQLEADGLPTEFTVDSHISHGIASISAISTVEDFPIPAELKTTTQLNGNTDYALNIASWHYQPEDNPDVSLTISPSSAEGSVTVLGELDFTMMVPSISLEFDSGESFLVEGLKAQGEGKKAKYIWLGEQSIEVEQVQVSDGISAAMALQNAKYTFNANEDMDTERLTSTHRVEIGEVDTTDGIVSNLDIDFTIGNLDQPSFAAIMEIYQNAVELTEQDVISSLPHLETLVERGFVLSMNNMSLTLGDGDFTSKWKLEVPEGTAGLTTDPLGVSNAVVGQLETNFTHALVDEYPFIEEGIDEAIIMEIVQESDSGYSINAQLVEGHLVFESGQKIPLMALILPMMMQ
ncbi:DUF945 family protein [Vibrio astriarenae]|uniref:DUF945 family protein n=1 Tax=Vibrio astriarenae TaxID=1481923 RepID=A0A7Z2YDS4_9VIBR|nr:DUF945 family protein [Vibrio astriarenae]QIA63678.1 DUF945 family protein [Vibrio astriarenae]